MIFVFLTMLLMIKWLIHYTNRMMIITAAVEEVPIRTGRVEAAAVRAVAATVLLAGPNEKV